MILPSISIKVQEGASRMAPADYLDLGRNTMRRSSSPTTCYQVILQLPADLPDGMAAG